MLNGRDRDLEVTEAMNVWIKASMHACMYTYTYVYVHVHVRILEVMEAMNVWIRASIGTESVHACMSDEWLYRSDE